LTKKEINKYFTLTSRKILPRLFSLSKMNVGSEMHAFSSLLAQRVKELRQGLGFTQDILAVLSGISVPDLKRIETAQADPTLTTLAALADSLQVSLRELFTIRK